MNKFTALQPSGKDADITDAASVIATWDSLLIRGAVLTQHFSEMRLSFSATSAARKIGFDRADALGRWLRRQHLPPYIPFRNGVYVVRLLELNEHGTSLAQWARQQGHYESVYYRFVLATTGLHWTTLVGLGSVPMKSRFLSEWTDFLGLPF